MAPVTQPVQIIEGLRPGLVECPAEGLAEFLGGPALLLIEGEREPPLFVSVLLHGNETSGWNGLRKLLSEPGPPPRSLIVFIGNVEAASAGLRTLPGQQDFNRIWRDEGSGLSAFTESVLAAAHARPVFAAIDLHNNTGHNPHYAIVTDTGAANVDLAYLFSDQIVFVREPDTVLTRALAEMCPAVAVELGPVGDASCDDRAFDYIKRCSALEVMPPADPETMRLYRTSARVHVAANVTFGFAGDEGEQPPLVLTGGIEAVNFHSLPVGAQFGATTLDVRDVLEVLDPVHRNVTDEYFEGGDGQIVLKQSVIPAMYTTDPLVIRQDCLCYFMETFDAPFASDTVT